MDKDSRLDEKNLGYRVMDCVLRSQNIFQTD